jgi:hypothetical protein
MLAIIESRTAVRQYAIFAKQESAPAQPHSIVSPMVRVDFALPSRTTP